MRTVLALGLMLFSLASVAQTYRSGYNCNAYTDCLSYDRYGRPYVSHRIYCEVYGHQMTNLPNGSECRWQVNPYQSVHCSGYQYNGYSYQWVNINRTCQQ